MRRTTLLLLVPLLVLAACGGDDDDGPTDTTDTTATTSTTGATEALSEEASIVYRYGDSSVPPEYHRSYTLTITKDGVHAVVDSYGDVLHDVTEPVPDEVWNELRETAGTMLELDVDPAEEPCAGGTSRGLLIEDAGEDLLDVSFAACGGSNEAAETAVDEWVQPVIDAIPDWDSYLATE